MTTTTAPLPTLSATIDRFLAAAQAGRGDQIRALYADDAVLDATVPSWRFQLRGPDRISRQYTGWFSEPGVFDELVRLPVAGGESVRYLIRSQEDGERYVAHHCHFFEVGADGLIQRDTFFCGGRWGDELVARMAAEQAQ